MKGSIYNIFYNYNEPNPDICTLSDLESVATTAAGMLSDVETDAGTQLFYSVGGRATSRFYEAVS